MLGNIGNLFMKCMQQVTKGHWYHRLGVSDHYVMYIIGRGLSLFSETSAMVTNRVTDQVIDSSVKLCKRFVIRGKEC